MSFNIGLGAGGMGPITPGGHRLRMAGQAFNNFASSPALLASIPLGVGAVGAATQLGDSSDNAAGNIADAVGQLGGGIGGGMAAGAAIKGLGAAIPPIGPWGAAAKAGLMLAGSAIGSGLGGNIARGVTDAVTGGATSNSPERNELRRQEALFQQQLRQKMQEISALLPAQKAQAVAAAEIAELQRRQEFQRTLDQGYANTLYSSLANQGARSSDMVANAINSVLYS